MVQSRGPGSRPYYATIFGNGQRSSSVFVENLKLMRAERILAPNPAAYNLKSDEQGNALVVEDVRPEPFQHLVR